MATIFKKLLKDKTKSIELTKVVVDITKKTKWLI